MTRAPMQRAVDAVFQVLAQHDVTTDIWPPPEREPSLEDIARAAITAAYPHLVGSLSAENSELREAANQMFSDLCEWRDIADELAEALGRTRATFQPWDCTDDIVATVDKPARAALARYDQAAR